MRNNLMAVLLAAWMVFSLAACGTPAGNQEVSGPAEEDAGEAQGLEGAAFAQIHHDLLARLLGYEGRLGRFRGAQIDEGHHGIAKGDDRQDQPIPQSHFGQGGLDRQRCFGLGSFGGGGLFRRLLHIAQAQRGAHPNGGKAQRAVKQRGQIFQQGK